VFAKVRGKSDTAKKKTAKLLYRKGGTSKGGRKIACSEAATVTMRKEKKKVGTLIQTSYRRGEEKARKRRRLSNIRRHTWNSGLGRKWRGGRLHIRALIKRRSKGKRTNGGRGGDGWMKRGLLLSIFLRPQGKTQST